MLAAYLSNINNINAKAIELLDETRKLILQSNVSAYIQFILWTGHVSN